MKTLLALLLFPLAAFSNNLFDSRETIKIKITAPFQSLFANKQSQNLTLLNQTIDGSLEVFNEYTQEVETYEIQLKMRGNMTLGSCDFPKLKVKFKKEQTTKKRLFNRKSYDLATHCINEVTPTSNYFQKNILSASPHRESFILDLQRDLGMTSPLTRNAIIDYIDNTNPDQIVTYANRDAFFIESTGNLIKRMNGLYPVIGTTDYSKKAMTSTEEEDDAPRRLFINVKENPQVNMEEVLKLTLFQVLVANMDFFIKTDLTQSPYGDIQLWNVKLMAQDENHWSIYGNDYNLAMITSNEHTSSIMLSSYSVKDIEKFKITGTDQERLNTLNFYLEKKESLYLKIQTLNQDPTFQFNYKLFLDYFYKQIDKIKAN